MLLLRLPRGCDPDPDPDPPAGLGLNMPPRDGDGADLRGGEAFRGERAEGVVVLVMVLRNDAPRAGVVTSVGELALLRRSVEFANLVGEVEWLRGDDGPLVKLDRREEVDVF
jgi:hypothetical protein